MSNNTHSNKPDKTPPLIPIAWARENKVVFDFDTGKFLFKDNPRHVYSAKAGLQANGQVGKKSYWLIPLTSRAFAETQSKDFNDLPEDQKKSFCSVADDNSFTHEDTPPSDSPSEELSPSDALIFLRMRILHR